MEQNDQAKVEEIMQKMDCSKQFKCAASNFERICAARDCGLNDYLECLEDNSRDCMYSLSFGMGFLCECPLRVYLSKNHNK